MKKRVKSKRSWLDDTVLVDDLKDGVNEKFKRDG